MVAHYFDTEWGQKIHLKFNRHGPDMGQGAYDVVVHEEQWRKSLHR